MEKFLLESHLGGSSDRDKRIHKDVEQIRELRRHRRTASLDIVTASAKAIAQANQAPADGNPRKRSTYTADDYRSSSLDVLEDALIEAIDKKWDRKRS